MAKKKKTDENTFWSDLQKTADTFDKENPVVDTKYIVEEGHWSHNEYDYGIDWVKHKSFEFNSAEEREAWLDEYEPDRHGKFRLYRQDIREFHPRPYISRMPAMFERELDK